MINNFDKIKAVLDFEGVGPDNNDEIAGKILDVLELDDAAVPHFTEDPGITAIAAEIERLEQSMTKAALGFEKAVAVAQGVKNAAVNGGFDEVIAQQMGQVCFVKLMGFGG